ncbi:MAG: hypothetical protein LUD27_06655 [Clostridia bacterium]|nr:hypothetical protein [Clostridia bacterium]
MENKYKVTLSDGTILDNLELNGNNFISEEEIDKAIFDNNLLSVTISYDDIVEVHTNMELIRFAVENGKTWFAIRDISSDKLEKLQLQADLEYIAMMAGIDL